MKKHLASLIVLSLAACTPQEASQDSQKSSGNLTSQAYELLEAGRTAQAAALFDQAIETDGRNIRAYQGKGITLDQQGKHGKAQDLYEKAREIDPEAIGPVNNLGMSYILQGDYSKAVELLTPYSKKEPVHAKVIENLALAHCLLGEEDVARKLYSKRISAKQMSENFKFCKEFESIRKK